MMPWQSFPKSIGMAAPRKDGEHCLVGTVLGASVSAPRRAPSLELASFPCQAPSSSCLYRAQHRCGCVPGVGQLCV
jgi:hypothetical protein